MTGQKIVDAESPGTAQTVLKYLSLTDLRASDGVAESFGINSVHAIKRPAK